MIGIFDSGSGGLTVLQALRDLAPQVDVVYFGDTKNAPYGNKTREELGALTVLGIERLIREGATGIVSACNSVSVSIALPMFDMLDIPRTHIIEMVGPALAALRGERTLRVLLLATHATIESGVYQEGIRILGGDVVCVAMPNLVAHIEGGEDTCVVKKDIEESLAPYHNTAFTHILLGCTHYPLVEEVFEEVAREQCIRGNIINPAYVVAKRAVTQYDTRGGGNTRFLLSQRSEVFERFVRHMYLQYPYTIDVV